MPETADRKKEDKKCFVLKDIAIVTTKQAIRANSII